MVEQELEKDSLRFMVNFEKVTKVFPKDVFFGDDYMLFIVPNGMKGKAIGQLGFNIKQLKEKTGKQIIICELFDDVKEMLAKYFENVTILKIKNKDGRYLVYVPDDDRGKAIGKNGHRIKALKQVFKKYFKDSDVAIRAISVVAQTSKGMAYYDVAAENSSEAVNISFDNEITLGQAAGIEDKSAGA